MRFRGMSDVEDTIWLAMADACFDGSGMSVSEQFLWAKNQGCLSIEAGESGVNDPESYYAAMQETGLFVHGVNVWVGGDVFFAKAIQAAIKLGASYITHQVPRQLNLVEGERFLKRHQKLCADHGLGYLIETHRWTASEKLSDLEHYLRAIPDLNIVSDISHYIPLLHEREEFDFLHPRTSAVHLRVAMPNNAQVEVGKAMHHEGCLLFKAIWKDLLKSGFSGPAVAEVIPFYLTYPRYNATEDNANVLALFKQAVVESGVSHKLKTNNVENV